MPLFLMMLLYQLLAKYGRLFLSGAASRYAASDAFFRLIIEDSGNGVQAESVESAGFLLFCSMIRRA